MVQKDMKNEMFACERMQMTYSSEGYIITYFGREKKEYHIHWLIGTTHICLSPCWQKRIATLA